MSKLYINNNNYKNDLGYLYCKMNILDIFVLTKKYLLRYINNI